MNVLGLIVVKEDFMRNKKGFTLIELISVVALLAIIVAIATPNILGMINNSKKQQFIQDASGIIGKAKYRDTLEKYKDLFETSGACRVITLRNLGYDDYPDADGNHYDIDATKVKICLENSQDVFYVVTKSKNNDGIYTRGVYDSSKSGGFVKEANLDIKYVTDF